jgi:hypothetical protein
VSPGYRGAGVLALLALLALLAVPIPAVAAPLHYVPKAGDTFSYDETIALNNGTGNYTGYTELSTTTGTESVGSIAPNGTANATWSYTVHWSNNSGASQTWTSAGAFSFSTLTYHYVHGTDNETGYSNPFVWFWMNNTLPVGGTFYSLGTQMSVLSPNESYHLASGGGRWVATIATDGTGSYQRNDVYGVFTATYDWKSYFDPNTGYIIGYVITEHDTNPDGSGFTYTDTLYVSSTSYPLTPATAPTSFPPPPPFPYGLVFLVVVIVLVIVVIIAVAASRSRRRARLPTHSPTGAVAYQPPPSMAPPAVTLNVPDQPMVQQIIMRDTVKVNCKFCGALIDSTAARCPNCGAPRA